MPDPLTDSWFFEETIAWQDEVVKKWFRMLAKLSAENNPYAGKDLSADNKKRDVPVATEAQGVYPSTHVSKTGSQADTKSQSTHSIKAAEISIAALIGAVNSIKGY